MDIGIIGISILLFCGIVIIGITICKIIHMIIKSTYWFITNRVNRNIENILILIWCWLVIIGVICIILGIYQI